MVAPTGVCGLYHFRVTSEKARKLAPKYPGGIFFAADNAHRAGGAVGVGVS